MAHNDFSDTHPKIKQMIIERLRQMTPAEKLRLVGDMNETVKHLAMVGLRERHPNDTPQQLRRRLADLLVGPELAEKAYGPFPADDEGDHAD